MNYESIAAKKNKPYIKIKIIGFIFLLCLILI